MDISYNIDEAFELAEQIERNGAAFYKRAAEILGPGAPQDLVLLLASQEEMHEKAFAGFRAELVSDEESINKYDQDGVVAQYLQAVAFKDQYIEGKFDNTAAEKLLLDVFTGSHPYAPFTIATLANAADILHTNPELYYVPKQRALGRFNDEFGDALYMIEERAADGHGDKASFGFSDELISTHDLLKNLRKNEKHQVDESTYVRARLFDMLIGDWDRHQDQWRWAVFQSFDPRKSL